MRSSITAGLILLIATAPTAPAAALDPGRGATQYRHVSWSLADGLRHGNVSCLLQGGDGYLWVGTAAGVARFDGVEFSAPTAPLAAVLEGRSVAALLEGRDGTLWAGTDEGLVVQRDGAVRRFGIEQGLSHSKITALALDGTGAIWVATLRGLNRLDGDRFTTFSTEQGLPSGFIQSLAFDESREVLWVGTFGGLARYREGRFESLDLGESGRSGITALLAEEGELWIGTADGALVLRGEDGSLRRWSAPDAVHALLKDRRGQLWLGTFRGAWRFRDGDFEAPEGVSDIVLALLEDREGNLWLGTRSGGLHRLSDASFVTWSTREGLPEGAVTTIVEDYAGDLWLGTRAGLVRVRGGRVVETLTTRDGLADDEIVALAAGEDGTLWVATQTGLHHVRDGEVRREPEGAVPIQGPYWRLLAAPGGDLWIAGYGGLARIGARGEAAWPASHPRDSGSALARDRAGRLWVGTLGSGVWSPDVPGLRFDAAQGLPSDVVGALLAASDGALWVGTAAGLARIEGTRLTAFGAEEGLPDEEIHLLLEGDDRALWMCTSRGVFRTELGELAEVAAGSAGHVRGRWFTTLDGMPISDCQSSGGFKVRDGKLWFPTPRGAAVVDPAHLVVNVVPPEVVLEALLVDGQPLGVDPGRELEPGSRRLEFRFTALSFRLPERVAFRYRLDGLDEEWMDAGGQRVAHYMNLPPGSYRFQVLAANEDGLWSTTPASLAFRLRPHLWATSWFRATAVAMAALIGFSLYRWREGRVNREFAAVLADRSRIAREIHDTLAQGLAGIAIQLEAADETLESGPELARQHLARALRLARSSLEEARRSVLGLRPRALEGTDLAAALRRAATDLTWGAELVVKLDLPSERKVLPRGVEDNILRIAQEAMSNTVRHARAKSLRVALGYARYAVTLRVLDDGVGFESDAVLAAPGDRLGLVGMRERAAELEGRLSVESEPGLGTEVVLTVPVS